MGTDKVERRNEVRSENQRRHSEGVRLNVLAGYGERMLVLDRLGSLLRDRGVWLQEIRLRLVSRERGGFLAVLKADVEGRASVAFVSAPTPVELLLAVLGHLQGGTLEWRPEKPYQERGTPATHGVA